jgi:ornithine cyclodeaminase/alanine dehydrogenase-like protein (mu-crystallin family)
MMADDSLLYLSRDSIASLGLGPAELIQAVEAAFAAYAAGRNNVGPKFAMPLGTGYFFQAMMGAVSAPDLAGMKWFGVVPDNPSRGLPNVVSLIVLNDLATGLPVVVMDGNWVTSARTGAMSAAAAKRLAPPEPRTIAFIGCGTQARSHALFLRHVFPTLGRAVLLGRGAASRDAFAGWLRDEGWQVRVVDGPDAAITDADIAVSTVPEYAGWRAFLDPARLPASALAVGVDLGRSWLPSRYGEFSIVATDETNQSRRLVAEGKLKAPTVFDADLAALVTGAHPGRRSSDKRAFFVFSGHVLGDLAVAAAIYERANKLGIGMRLPR